MAMTWIFVFLCQKNFLATAYGGVPNLGEVFLKNLPLSDVVREKILCYNDVT